MQVNKNLSKKITKTLRIKLLKGLIFSYIDKKIGIYVSMILIMIFSFSFITIYTQFHLTDIGRENLFKIKEIEKVNNEISKLKLEIMELNNLIVIQKELRKIGFIDNDTVNYINK